jgi:thioredoxin reductase
MMETEELLDVLIIGGSVAGLSAALTLGRSRRRVLVLDSNRPCNRQTPHSHSFFTRDGETPQRLLAIGREQLQAYPTVSVQKALVTQVERVEHGFRLITEAGQTFVGKKLLLATGLTDQLPAIPGFAESWGISVLHCPYCHGYEVRDEPLGVLANGAAGFDFTRLLHQWSTDLRLFTNGPSELTAEQTAHLAARNVRIIETSITEIEHRAGQLQHLCLSNGERIPLTALFARVPFTLSGGFHDQLGCELTEQGLIRVDDFGRTTVPGVSAAGDNSNMMRQVSTASANGSKAGALLNRDLVEEEF